eukprot:1167999-Amphidinium_carterae.1
MAATFGSRGVPLRQNNYGNISEMNCNCHLRRKRDCSLFSDFWGRPGRPMLVYKLDVNVVAHAER